jgi:transcriptional regulator with XRE-family HTH domain
MFTIEQIQRAIILTAELKESPNILSLIQSLMGEDAPIPTPTPHPERSDVRISTRDRDLKNNPFMVARAARRLTQAEVAARSKVSHFTIHQLEHNRRVNPIARAKVEKFFNMPQSIPTPTPRRGRPKLPSNMKAHPAPPALIAKLRETRHAQNLTAEELSLRLGVHPQYIRHIENGRRRPSYAAMLNISKALSIPVSDFGDLSTLVLRPRGRNSRKVKR